MRAHEFISEGPAQVLSGEIVQAARYIAKWLAEYKPLRSYTVPQMFGGADKIPFKITSPELEKLFGKDGLAFTANPLVFKGKPTTVGGYNQQLQRVAVSPDILNDVDMVTSVLAHELTHGTDVYRYGGRLHMAPTGKMTGADYLKQPHEINARFTQALYDIAKEPSAIKSEGGNAVQKINAVLANNRLDRNTFPAGPEGQKQYDRLRSRAYQFMQQMEPMIDPGKPINPSMFDRIRKMVTTFATF